MGEQQPFRWVGGIKKKKNKKKEFQPRKVFFLFYVKVQGC